jgi:outer membrane protein assembly factor BamD (BamD/ComL family)
MPRVCFLLIFFMLLGQTFVSAQEDMSFSEEEVDEVRDASPVVKFLDEGTKYYEQKEYYQASLLFYKVIEEQDASATSLHPRAQYELAKSLYRLKFYQGSLSLFQKILDVGDEHPYYEATLSWLILLNRKLPGDPEALSRMSQYAAYYPDRVPEKFRDEFAYLLGRHYYQEADLEQALQFLKDVSSTNDFYPESQFLTGITHVRNYEARPAVAAFKNILGFLAEKDLSEPRYKNMEQLTLLTMARAFYSTRQYDKAVKYYNFIPQGSEYWLMSLFEESWAYFQGDGFNKALGNLHTLNSPFFDDEYFPESVILQAVIFYTNCRYDRVRLTIEEFNLVYPDLKEQLNSYLDQYQDPTALYEFLVQINEGKGDFDTRLNQILSAALTDKTLKRTIGFVEELDQELAILSKTDPSWRDSSLGKWLEEELTFAKSYALSTAGDLARARLDRVSRELNDLIKQSKKILIETAKAETSILDQQLKDQGFKGTDDSSRLKDIVVDDEHVYWTFKGEYWRDELGFYLYNIRRQCGR